MLPFGWVGGRQEKLAEFACNNKHFEEQARQQPPMIPNFQLLMILLKKKTGDNIWSPEG